MPAYVDAPTRHGWCRRTHPPRAQGPHPMGEGCGAGRMTAERGRAWGRGRSGPSPSLWSTHAPRTTDLDAGGDVDKQDGRRPPEPLARELMRYTVAGGLASLVDVGLLVMLTHWGGGYLLQAATLAFGCGLITSRSIYRGL